MRRRGRYINYGEQIATRSRGYAMDYPEERPLVISEVPDAWRKHAREPWRILFPNLDWSPPKSD